MNIDIGILQYILQGAFPSLSAAVFLAGFIFLDRTFPGKTLNLFLTALLFTVILAVSETLDHWFYVSGFHIETRKLLAAIGFSTRVCIIGFTVAISQRFSTKTGVLLYAGMIINAVFSFISIPTGCIFFFDANNEWHMGPFFFIPYIFIAYYGILLVISSFKKLSSNFGEAVITIGICLICLMANLIELKTNMKFLLSTAFSVGICIYFLCLNVQLYRRDSLTNLLNRRSFYMDAQRFSMRKLTVLSLDMNDLKKINDQEGHLAGDKALCTIANVMLSSFRYRGLCYRIGGDEFIVMFIDKTEPEVRSLLIRFRKKMYTTKYSVAGGYAECPPNGNIELAVCEADKKMYENKKLIKGCEGR